MTWFFQSSRLAARATRHAHGGDGVPAPAVNALCTERRTPPGPPAETPRCRHRLPELPSVICTEPAGHEPLSHVGAQPGDDAFEFVWEAR